MPTVIEITASAAGVIAAGLYLRWGVTPVLGAYKIGRFVGGRYQRHH